MDLGGGRHLVQPGLNSTIDHFVDANKMVLNGLTSIETGHFGIDKHSPWILMPIEICAC